jgi:hypothetical protein
MWRDLSKIRNPQNTDKKFTAYICNIICSLSINVTPNAKKRWLNLVSFGCCDQNCPRIIRDILIFDNRYEKA